MRWANRLARLSNPHVDSADSVDSPPDGSLGSAFSQDTPMSIVPIVSLGKANDAKDTIDKGVEEEKSLAAAPTDGASLPAPPAEIEALALVLLEQAERHPATRIPDTESAMPYFRGEALRRLELIRQRAIDAISGEDIERAAIMEEEGATMASPEAHKMVVAGLLLTAGPLAGTPGARACKGCGRGIWCSPGWRGSPPDICFACSRGAAP